MSTTFDASGVEELDATLVAVKVLSPRAVWTRTKIRVLQAIRRVRGLAAERQAAIAQFVKPYWERIPSGLPGFAMLAAMAHKPSYRWVMRRVETVTSFTGAMVKTGLSLLGRGTRWLGRASAKAVGWVWPSAGERLGHMVENASIRTTLAFHQFCATVSRGHKDFYTAATNDAATSTMTKLALPLALGVGVNLASQGLLAALVSSIPVVGLPLAAMLGTARGMSIAAGIIASISLYDGYGQLRSEKSAPAAPAQPAAAPADPATGESAATEAKPVQETEKVITTREVEIDGETKLVVEGTTDPEEVDMAREQHAAQVEADEAAHLKELEAEVAHPAGKRSTAQAHGPQPRGRRGQAQGKKAVPSTPGQPTPSGSR